ncbi:MAG: hypothetical protein ABI855_00525 [Bacteroidota bacterium]
MLTIEETTIEIPEKEYLIYLHPRIKNKLCRQSEEEGQVIIHCSLSLSSFSRIRIWMTTYLFDKHSSHRSRLLHVEGIHVYPQEWMQVSLPVVNFTLIFSSLPRHCKVFDMYEQTQGDPGNFSAKAIVRNESDVYHVDFGY